MIRTFFCAIACLSMASVGTAHAGIVFDFLNEGTELGGLLDGNSSGMITIGGLTITVTANPGDFNGTASDFGINQACLLYTSPSPRDATLSRMPSSA